MLPKETMASESSSNLLAKVGRHLAHELNNPISAITSSVYLIEDMISSDGGTVSAEEIRPFVESIQEECAALKATVEEFTKFATTERILATKIDLSEFVRARAEEMARDGLPATASTPPESCFVNADTAGLAFVLRQLAESAREAGATKIHFSLAVSDSVSDDCKIMMNDDRPSAAVSDLESDFSAESVATRPRGSGLRLKLPLAKKIIELHGGNIAIASAAGTETQIVIALPKISNESA